MLGSKSDRGDSIGVSQAIKVPDAKRRKPAKILVIDDEPEITDIVETFLETAGYEVESENASQPGIDRAKVFLPDLVLLDIMMPTLDGYEICSELKRSEKTKRIPVVFLTGKDARSDEGKSFKVGGVLYIKKPFSCERLLDIVKVVLQTVDKENK
ncbi:MAG: response regulator [Candidatus Zixiibacteriota bacterium]|nr:MAG: response regulator [candidate division Zixibacteria bacterium]